MNLDMCIWTFSNAKIISCVLSDVLMASGCKMKPARNIDNELHLYKMMKRSPINCPMYAGEGKRCQKINCSLSIFSHGIGLGF